MGHTLFAKYVQTRRPTSWSLAANDKYSGYRLIAVLAEQDFNKAATALSRSSKPTRRTL
jgi:hypothetical protein